ncbi:hypothetical protein BJV78DRAFT_1219790, partial [Lactifluus subvellereus]
MRRFRAPETPIRVVFPFRGLFTIDAFPGPPRLGAACSDGSQRGLSTECPSPLFP